MVFGASSPTAAPAKRPVNHQNGWSSAELPQKAAARDSSARFYRKHGGLHVAAQVSLNVDERFTNRYRALVNKAQLNLQSDDEVMLPHTPTFFFFFLILPDGASETDEF